MINKNIINYTLYFLFFIFLIFNSCETEDILPNIQLSVDSNNLSEDNGLVTLTASLNSSLKQQTSVAILVGGQLKLQLISTCQVIVFLLRLEIIHHQLKLHLCKTTKLKALKV